MTTLKITIAAPKDRPNILDVQQAMRQVLEYFDLMTDQGNTDVVWNLTSAHTSSPFTVTGEPVDLRTGAGGVSAIRDHVNTMRRGLERLRNGEEFDTDFPAEKRVVVANLLRRNTNGIGTTTLSFDDDEAAIEFDQPSANRSLDIIEDRQDDIHEYLFSSFARREIGSIEGVIVDVGTDSDEPAIHLEDALTGRRISCRFDSEASRRLEGSLKAKDVWKKRRVRVQGKVNYDASGKIIRLYEGQLEFIEHTDIEIEELFDPDFTGGMAPREYLDRLWEGELE